MYQYACHKKQVAHIRSRIFEDTITLPSPLQPLANAESEEAYQIRLAHLAELQKQMEATITERKAEMEQLKSEKTENEQSMENADTSNMPNPEQQQISTTKVEPQTQEEHKPKLNPYLEKQLEEMKAILVNMTNEKMSDIQTKLGELEAAVAEQLKAKAPTATKKK